MPTFAVGKCHVASVTDPSGRNVVFFFNGTAAFYLNYVLSFSHEAEWTPSQTNYFLKSLVALGIEPGPVDL
jgi:hypothetical protein